MSDEGAKPPAPTPSRKGGASARARGRRRPRSGQGLRSERQRPIEFDRHVAVSGRPAWQELARVMTASVMRPMAPAVPAVQRTRPGSRPGVGVPSAEQQEPERDEGISDVQDQGCGSAGIGSGGPTIQPRRRSGRMRRGRVVHGVGVVSGKMTQLASTTPLTAMTAMSKRSKGAGERPGPLAAPASCG